MKVIFTTEARQNLRDIGDYIARDNPARAKTFIRELQKRALAIGHVPRAFPLYREFEGFEVRRRAHGDYLILYTIESNHVAILFIVHGARDYEALLFAEPKPQ